jgi:hypothetical protein
LGVAFKIDGEGPKDLGDSVSRARPGACGDWAGADWLGGTLALGSGARFGSEGRLSGDSGDALVIV